MKDRTKGIVTWVALGVLFVWLLVFTVMAIGEFKAINAVLIEEAEMAEGSVPYPAPEAANISKPDVRVGGAEVLSDTVVMTVTARSSGSGDLLYEAPELVDGSGNTYPVTGESLEEARFAFLDLVTKGQVTVQMEFSGTPSESEKLTLVFNPNQTVDKLYVAPKVEARVW